MATSPLLNISACLYVYCIGFVVPTAMGETFMYDADGAVQGTIRTVNTTYAAALKTTTHPKTRCRIPYVTQHLMLLMMGLCTRNMSSYEYINKIT